jgi:hypothetical protein
MQGSRIPTVYRGGSCRSTLAAACQMLKTYLLHRAIAPGRNMVFARAVEAANRPRWSCARKKATSRLRSHESQPSLIGSNRKTDAEWRALVRPTPNCDSFMRFSVRMTLLPNAVIASP